VRPPDTLELTRQDVALRALYALRSTRALGLMASGFTAWGLGHGMTRGRRCAPGSGATEAPG
jgi:hypothetical protein